MAYYTNADFIYFNPNGETVFLAGDSKRRVGVTENMLRSCAGTGRTNYATGEKVRLRMCRLTTGVGTTLEEFSRFMARLNEMPE